MLFMYILQICDPYSCLKEYIIGNNFFIYQINKMKIIFHIPKYGTLILDDLWTIIPMMKFSAISRIF